jgi:hypothetical protein
MAGPVHTDRVLLVSTIFSHTDVGLQIGGDAYSYYFAYRAFLPYLEQYCQVREVSHPESRLVFAARKAREEGLYPIHLAFLPPQKVYYASDVPTVVFPFWEFPDIPNRNLENRRRENWVAMCSNTLGIITACNSARDAFRRANVQCPTEILPVPIHQSYFELQRWRKPKNLVVACHWYELKIDDTENLETAPAAAAQRMARLRSLLRIAYRPFRVTFPGLSDRFARYVMAKLNGLSLGAKISVNERNSSEAPERNELALSGIVFTSIFNPFDGRKNWGDLLTGALRAFKDNSDVTIVLKLVVTPQAKPAAMDAIQNVYQHFNDGHRCRLVIIADYLTEQQMLDLTRGSAFYFSASRAEGACLPLQDYLAAGRPGIAPYHTAMMDYFDGDVGFVVESSIEPVAWPHDPAQIFETTWARISQGSLQDCLQSAYKMMKSDPIAYRRLGERGRERMRKYASGAALRSRISSVLDSFFEPGGEKIF